MTVLRWIRWFRDIGIEDIPLVGGKNASLGEMYRALTPQGIRIPNGFAVTAEAYRLFLSVGGLSEQIATLLEGLDTRDLAALADRGRRLREAILASAAGRRCDSAGPGLWPQSWYLRPGAERLPRVRPLPGGLQDRQYFAQPGHHPQDHPGDRRHGETVARTSFPERPGLDLSRGCC